MSLRRRLRRFGILNASLHTPLCDLLGIRVPLLLAGMAGGPTTPELVAAVSASGGLGVFGASGMPAELFRRDLRRARELTSAPIGVNVLLAEAGQPSGDLERLSGQLDRYRQELSLPRPADRPPPATANELVKIAVDEGASVLSVGLGDPAAVVEIASAHGLPVIAMVATVDDARKAADSGASVLVAQGSEAGGHRSNFTLPDNAPPPMVGLMALLPQVVAAVDIPVVAAGGIVDGRGLVAALALGAVGAQLGTRFLVAHESGTSAGYRSRVLGAGDDETVVTTALSGRPARGLPNRILRDLETLGSPSLGYPRQAAGWADIRQDALKRDDADFASLWCGQRAGAGLTEASAAQIIAEIEAEAIETIGRLGRGSRG